METPIIVIFLFLFLFVVLNMSLYYFLLYIPTTINKKENFTADEIPCKSDDPNLPCIKAGTSYNDPQYKDITNPSGYVLNNPDDPMNAILPFTSDPRTQYRTNNYDVQYHDEYDLSTIYFPESDVFKIQYLPVSSFPYGPTSYVPTYTDAVLLSRIHNPPLSPSLQEQENKTEYTLPIPPPTYIPPFQRPPAHF